MSQQQGIFQRWRVALFGPPTKRLQERSGANHLLSYLLVGVQSSATVLALGHHLIQLLYSSDRAIQSIALMALGLLVASVIAADMCLLSTLRRVSALSRNRQGWALAEHLAYMLFVLAVEGGTLGIVLKVLDTDPAALVSDAPIIPADGLAFYALIGARVLLTVWTSVQLFIVRGKLPPQWSTLLLEARELLGGKASASMAALDLDGASLSTLFDAYSQVSRPPALIPTRWNRSAIRRIVEEDRQREAVVRALSDFETPAHTGMPLPAPVTPNGRGPTGPGSPVAASDQQGLRNPPAGELLRLPSTPRKRRPAARASAGVRNGVRTPQAKGMIPASVEPVARAAWMPNMGPKALQKATGISRASAQKYAAQFQAEHDKRGDEERAAI
jgi:hypothetical protein